MSSSEENLSELISSLKKEARALKKAKRISQSKALTFLAKKHGFQSWRHLIKTANREEYDLKDHDLSRRQISEIEEGRINQTFCYFHVINFDYEKARTEIREQLVKLKQESPQYHYFYVVLSITPILNSDIESLGSFIKAVKLEFKWVNELEILVSILELSDSEIDSIYRLYEQRLQAISKEMAGELISKGDIK